LPGMCLDDESFIHDYSPAFKIGMGRNQNIELESSRAGKNIPG